MRRDLRLEITDAAKDYLAEIGYDPTYGARPLKRAIQRHLENRLAEDILAGRYAPGDTIHIDRGEDGALSFGKEAAKSEGSSEIHA